MFNMTKIPSADSALVSDEIKREFLLRQIIKIAKIMNKYIPLIVNDVIDSLPLKNIDTAAKELYILSIMHDYPKMGFIKHHEGFMNAKFSTY